MERYEQRAGDTCFGIWQPETVGMPFVAQKGNPWPLRCDDVAETRAALEAKGVEFYGETFDTGVCHMAIFADPDGNELMLHRRYAPAEVTHQVAAVVVDDLADRVPAGSVHAVEDLCRRPERFAGACASPGSGSPTGEWTRPARGTHRSPVADSVT